MKETREQDTFCPRSSDPFHLESYVYKMGNMTYINIWPVHVKVAVSVRPLLFMGHSENVQQFMNNNSLEFFYQRIFN